MDIKQSNESRMSGRGDGGALLRVERRGETGDPEGDDGAGGYRLGRGSAAQHWIYTWRKQTLRGAMASALYRSNCIVFHVGQSSRIRTDRGSRTMRPDGVGGR